MSGTIELKLNQTSAAVGAIVLSALLACGYFAGAMHAKQLCQAEIVHAHQEVARIAKAMNELYGYVTRAQYGNREVRPGMTRLESAADPQHAALLEIPKGDK